MQDSEGADKSDWQERVDKFDSVVRPILKKYGSSGSTPDATADNDDFEFKDEL